MRKLFATRHLIILGATKTKYLRDRVSVQNADILKGNFVGFFSGTLDGDFLTEIILLDSSIAYTPSENVTFLPRYDLRNSKFFRFFNISIKN